MLTFDVILITVLAIICAGIFWHVVFKTIKLMLSNIERQARSIHDLKETVNEMVSPSMSESYSASVEEEISGSETVSPSEENIMFERFPFLKRSWIKINRLLTNVIFCIFVGLIFAFIICCIKGIHFLWNVSF